MRARTIFAFLLVLGVALAGGPVELDTIKAPTEQIPGKCLILVVDVSGSMAGHYGEAIELASQFAESASDDYQLHCVTFGSFRDSPKTWPSGWAEMPDLEKLNALSEWLKLQQREESQRLALWVTQYGSTRGLGTHLTPAVALAKKAAGGGKIAAESYLIVITDGELNDVPKLATPAALLQVGGFSADRLDKLGGECKLGWYRPRKAPE